MTGNAAVAGRGERIVRWALPVVTLALFVLTARGYGVFRDELYYVACGRHLAWGYVDHPPFVALVAALSTALFGTSLLGLRLFPALAAAGTVLLVGESARALGGGRFARLLAQLLAATAPVFLSLFTILSMNAFDLLIWAGLGWIAARLLAGDDPRLWLAFGALAGVGLENKIDVGLLGAGLVVGIVVSRRFDLLRNRWPWLGGALAFALFLPHLIWQALHGWPTREFVARAQSGKIVRLEPWQFVAAQVDTVGPVAAALALAGLGWLLLARHARYYRALGWAVLVVLAAFVLTVSKPYYFSPAFTLLFPAAGVAIETWTTGRFGRLARGFALFATALILVAAPLAKPLLPVEQYLRYAEALGERKGSDEHHEIGRLPQFFADMHGWRELAMNTARVFAQLPPEDRMRACVYGNNYGEAGAIDFFGPELGLPPAVSGHNNYWLWGPGACSGEVLLILGGEAEDHARQFESVEPGMIHRCGDCMPYENDLTIWVARGLRRPFEEVWPAVRHFD